MGGPGLALALVLAGPAAIVDSTQDAPAAPRPRQERPEPYRGGGGSPLEFRGPGRDDPEAQDGEVRFAWFGPADPDHPEFGELWRGATLALEEENAAGGYVANPPDAGGGQPSSKLFRLSPVWSENPWQAGITDLTRLVYEGGLVAVVGGVDGTTTHLAVQTALKARIPLVSPGSTDVSADHANVPWLFSLPPSDAAQAVLLADALASRQRDRFAIAAATDHDSHAAVSSLRRALARRGLGAVTLVEFERTQTENAELASRLSAGRPRTIVILAPGSVAGSLVRTLRRSGFAGEVLGGATLATRAFQRAAGDAAEGVRAPLAVEDGPAFARFRAAFERRWGDEPDAAAANGYDAVRLLAAAVRRAGPNRARVRDELRSLAPWPGAAGVVRWDAVGRNERPAAWAAWKKGRLMAER